MRVRVSPPPPRPTTPATSPCPTCSAAPIPCPASTQGFKKWNRPGIQVRINDSVEVDIDLQLGATSETVEVSATTPLLATAEASLGQVVDERRVLELPQFAGNAMDLVHLAPGTINGTNLRLRKAGFNNAPSTFSTDGGGNNQNEFSIDGVSNTYSDGTAPRVAFSPPQFAISEFKIQTSTFDAALGHTMGSTVNVSIKSGTNKLHGEMHEWFRHSILDAPTIFQNRSGQTISIYQDNRYGASAGAPVYHPEASTTARTRPSGSSPTKPTSSATRIRAATSPPRCPPRRCTSATSPNTSPSAPPTSSTIRAAPR